MAAASKEEEEKAKRKIKDVLEEMKPLPGRISELLLHHRGRRLTAADDRVLQCWEYMQAELSGIVASLTQMYSSSELGPDYLDKDFWLWLYMSSALARDTRTCLPRSEQATPRGCYAQLHRAAALPHPGYITLPMLLSRVTEPPCRYKQLVQDDDGDRNSRTSSSYAVHVGGDTYLVGIEGALRNRKLRWFMADREDNETVKVISMVGPAGVGKTALAMEVYRRLQQIGGGHHFQCCATVKVSQRPDIKELLKHIFWQIDRPVALAPEARRSLIATLEDEQELLVASINQCLKDRRYLIVIDDIWKESDWNIIKNAFPHNSLGSRIMITTQLTSVARLCCPHFDGLVHKVEPLRELDSKRFLLRKAFGSEDGCPPKNLNQVCDEILKRCEGIPFFITGMADWLQEQRKVHHMSTNYSMEIVPRLPKQFEQALVTIYDDLPYLSKVLLMYMSIFPEGYMFDKDSLIEKLICQGIYFNYEEVIKYFPDLVDRNVITRVAATPKHTPQMEAACSWKVNYFMLQFLASKSADKGFRYTEGTLTSVVAEGREKLRCLSLHQPDPKLPELLREMDLNDTRSLALWGKVDGIPLDKFIYLMVLDLEGWQRFKEEDMVSICKMFLLRYLSLRNTRVSKLSPEIKELRWLRTLDVSHTQISELPPQVCELKRLQRLDLSHTQISELPPQVCELEKLQTLDLSHTQISELPSQVCRLDWLDKLDLRSTQVRRLPEQIWKLVLLTQLLIGGDGVNRYEAAAEIPDGVGLKRLETLATVDLSEVSVVEALGGAGQLRELAITWSFHQCTDRRFKFALRSSMENWLYLKSLTIHCGVGCCMDFLDSLPAGRPGGLQKFKVPGGRFARLPRWFRGLGRLTFIEITVCNLLPGEVGILGKLPKLECLVLGLNFIPEAAIVIEAEVNPVEVEVESVPSQEEYLDLPGNVLFRGLRRLSVSCRVPWLTFMQGAMPELTFIELKLAGSTASQESVPSGISNLLSLSDVAIQYSKWFTNSLGVKRTVEAVRKGVAEHCKPINLFINGIEDEGEYVQAVEEDPARASGNQE